MKNFLRSTTFTVGLAIFSMFFGAGNLILPIQTGLSSGDKFGYGMLGYMLTAVLLPLLGLIAMILFNGDYKEFFGRLGKIPGFISILFCMCVIGPCIAMSRIITLSYEMLLPFISAIDYEGTIYTVSLPAFSILFCLITFLGTFRDTSIINLLGKWISPLLLGSLGIIIFKGILNPQTPIATDLSKSTVFWEQLKFGYASLDLLGALFFASALLTLLKRTVSDEKDYNLRTLALTGMKAGFIGCSLLGLIYYGLGLLGSYYGPLFLYENSAELFSKVSFAVMGEHGALVIALAVAMACYSTIVALAMVVAEYIHKELTLGFITYTTSLVATLCATAYISCFGLSTIMQASGPVINVCYPVLIVITYVNILYKLFNFKPIKIPALIALLVSVYYNVDYIHDLFTNTL